MEAPIIIPIIEQHAEEAAFLWLQRDAAIGAPNYSLDDLAKLDNRVDAHLDGLRIAGVGGWEICENALEMEEAGEVFAAAMLAFEYGDGEKIDKVVSIGSKSPELFRGLVSALGWQNNEHLNAILPSLLNANSLQYQRVGIAASAIHRIDPGHALTSALESSDLFLRARALRAVGELKRGDLLPVLRQHFQSEDVACRFWSAWSALLLGDQSALEPLKGFVTLDSPYLGRTLQILLRAMGSPNAQNWLTELAQQLSQQSTNATTEQLEIVRFVLIGAGIVGDPAYIPTLIQQMETPELARAAGDAFTMITGVDLAYEDLEGEWPEGFEAGPTENPEDEDVEMDPDEDLPWPDPVLIQKWWGEHERHFQIGTRYLVGKPINQQQCHQVLKSGTQTQRAATALELALMQPNNPLFEVRAPGFRQQHILV